MCFALSVPGAVSVCWVSRVDAEGDALVAWCLAGVVLAVVGVYPGAVGKCVVDVSPVTSGEQTRPPAMAVDGHCAVPPRAPVAGWSYENGVDDLDSSHFDGGNGSS